MQRSFGRRRFTATRNSIRHKQTCIVLAQFTHGCMTVTRRKTPSATAIRRGVSPQHLAKFFSAAHYRIKNKLLIFGNWSSCCNPLRSGGVGTGPNLLDLWMKASPQVVGTKGQGVEARQGVAQGRRGITQVAPSSQDKIEQH
jgi:hypothetical protein